MGVGVSDARPVADLPGRPLAWREWKPVTPLPAVAGRTVVSPEAEEFLA
ncbi:hypothetical protein APASM_5932 [Actinosynnema pretiosum subsp. pretiosum]|nr:hypothetical protein APASM_5932 [Actinosynnema pretiosum subsp. pretiosum]